MKKQCVDPSAPIVNCVVCGAKVYTCERKIPINNDYRCSVHPDGVETEDGWFCSEKCQKDHKTI